MKQAENIQDAELVKAFHNGYALRTIGPASAVLIANNSRPMAFISEYGQGRTIFIGRELFHVRIEERRSKQDQGGDALRDWLKYLVTQIAPTE